MNEINSILNSLLTETTEPYPVYVDNHHTSFIQFPNEYEMPQVSNHILSFEEKLKLTRIFAKLIPNTLIGMHILPEPYPKRDTSKLCFVKEFTFLEHTYIYFFKIDINYLGGSQKEKMTRFSNQKQFPSYLTDRIYFYSGIVEVTEILRKEEDIINFKPKDFNQSLYFKDEEVFIEKNKPEIFSEIFDDADTKHILIPLYEKLKINSETWKLGKIHQPIQIEHSSIVLKPLQMNPNDVFEKFKSFSGILDTMNDKSLLTSEYLEKFHEYLKSHRVVRGLSPSGNIRWKIEFNSSS